MEVREFREGHRKEVGEGEGKERGMRMSCTQSGRLELVEAPAAIRTIPVQPDIRMFVKALQRGS
jgi:hypothetical protein